MARLTHTFSNRRDWVVKSDHYNAMDETITVTVLYNPEENIITIIHIEVTEQALFIKDGKVIREGVKYESGLPSFFFQVFKRVVDPIYSALDEIDWETIYKDSLIDNQIPLENYE